MMRAIGFLAGVALTVAGFLLVLDTLQGPQPETRAAAPATGQAEPALAATADATADETHRNPPDVPLPAGDAPELGDSDPAGLAASAPDRGGVEGPALVGGDEDTTGEVTSEDLSEVLAAVAEQVDAPRAATDPDPASPAADTDPSGQLEGAPPEPMPGAGVQARAGIETSGTGSAADTDRYLFWSPFRSAWSARGFARRLTAATQVPVEVVDAGPGRYRVGFSYRDEAQRRVWISRIETITGLQLE
ncbi:MAG: hypothetical protein PVI91_07630 [Gammaproteobacteria bacterium]|jgi:hypothetical protein